MKKLMKKMVTYLCALSLAMSMPTAVTAHPGRTDSQGGHHDYKNASGLGSYHYHHGYGPHLHENGVCPYDSSSTQETSSSTKKASSSAKKTKVNANLKKAQKKLNELGYSCGTADGIMGKKTRQALKKFQKAKGIKVTGTLTKKTKKKLGIQ